MEISVDHAAKQIIIFLTRAEGADAALREQVRGRYAGLCAQKYRLVEFCSGARDLYDLTEGLLLHNRTAAAKRDMAQQS